MACFLFIKGDQKLFIFFLKSIFRFISIHSLSLFTLDYRIKLNQIIHIKGDKKLFSFLFLSLFLDLFLFIHYIFFPIESGSHPHFMSDNLYLLISDNQCHLILDIYLYSVSDNHFQLNLDSNYHFILKNRRQLLKKKNIIKKNIKIIFLKLLKKNVN